MSDSPSAVSPLRRAMVSELTLRRYAPSTIKSYVGAVSLLARHYNRCPSRITDEEVILWLRHRLAQGLAGHTVNVALHGVRFMWREILHRPVDALKLPKIRRTQKLPEALSQQEVRALLDAHPKRTYRAALHLLYGCGLRISELARLEVRHIDRATMRVRVEQAKGNKDRYTVLPRRALLELETYWRAERWDSASIPWLFPGRGGNHLGTDAIYRAYNEAKRLAGISKRGGVHALRHSFATHHLMAGTDLVTLQRMLGHKHLRTTARYLQIVLESGHDITSPLDTLFQEDGPEAS